LWEGGVSLTTADLEKKVAFYQSRAEQASTRIDEEYWRRIARYWHALKPAAADEFDDQVN
jgi:hypothetical protein